MTRIDRRNRAALSLICLALVVAAGLALARSYGAFGDRRAGAALYDESSVSFVDNHQSWLWPAVAGVGLLVAYVGWRWFRSQFRSWSTLESTDFVAEDPLGSTRIRTDALCAALEYDVETYAGIVEAIGEIRSASPPRVDLFVTLQNDVDLVAVRERIDAQALPRLCATIGVQKVLSIVRLRLVSEETGLI